MSAKIRGHPDLANVTERCLTSIQVGSVLRPTSHPSQLTVGPMPGNQHIARVAHDGGAKEIVRLTSKPYGHGAWHGYRAHEGTDVGLIFGRRPMEVETGLAAHLVPRRMPCRLNASRRKSGL
jgi:hypothetical protein